MPRYYIDVRSHFGIDEDTNGIELPDISAARIEALKVAEQLLKSWAGMLPHYSSEIVIEVVGEDLRPLLSIPCIELGPMTRE